MAIAYVPIRMKFRTIHPLLKHKQKSIGGISGTFIVWSRQGWTLPIGCTENTESKQHGAVGSDNHVDCGCVGEPQVHVEKRLLRRVSEWGDVCVGGGSMEREELLGAPK